MKPENVKALTQFDILDGQFQSLQDFEHLYQFEADGILFYRDVSKKTVAEQTGLNATHRGYLDGLLSYLQTSERKTKYVVVGLQPTEPTVLPFAFLDSNLAFLELLAADLAEYEVLAEEAGGKLEIVIRFASEMNDPGNTKYGPKRYGPGDVGWATQQAAYRESFAKARKAFREVAPNIRFSFSPALRADLEDKFSRVPDYWPGNKHADILGGTWYVGSQGQFAKSRKMLRRYLKEFDEETLPHGIDEMGGVDGTIHNDAILKQMFEELENQAPLRFEYVSLFLEQKWGNDVTLKFLRPTPAPLAVRREATVETTFETTARSSPAIAILQSNAEGTLIQVDPSRCRFAAAAPLGGAFHPPAGSLVANANFYFQSLPIGAMVSEGSVLASTPLPANKPRTALVIKDGVPEFTAPLTSAQVAAIVSSGDWDGATVVQAGPRLIRDGSLVEAEDENIRDDVRRKTRHVGVGITAAGKLLFRYVSNKKLSALAEMLLADGAVDAMNMDGGHAAHLRFGSTIRGASSPFTALIATPEA